MRWWMVDSTKVVDVAPRLFIRNGFQRMVDAERCFEMAEHIDEVDGEGDDVEGGGV